MNISRSGTVTALAYYNRDYHEHWDACILYPPPHRDLVEPVLCPDAVLLMPDGISCHHIPGFLLVRQPGGCRLR